MERLKCLLLQQMITRPRFKWNLPVGNAQTLLEAAYRAEVEYRQRSVQYDQTTQDNVKRVAEALTNEKSAKFGLMLCGLFGNGKTTMLYAVRNATNFLSDQGMWTEPKGIVITDAKEVGQYARDIRRFNDLRQKELLAVEDMGREANEIVEYGNVISPVIDLLEYRYNHQLFTIITTNLRAEEIRAKYGPRIADRFNEMLDVIVFRGVSYRN